MPRDLTIVLLGEQWRPIIPLVGWLGVFGAVVGASNSLSTVLFVTGHGRFTTVKTWLEVAATAIALSITVRIGGLEDIVAVRTAVAIPTLPLMIYFTTRCTALSARELFGVLWRLLCAAIVMLFVVRGVEGAGHQGHAVELITGMAVGGATYIGVLLFLWVLWGRPPGPEASILGFVKGKLARGPVAAQAATVGPLMDLITRVVHGRENKGLVAWLPRLRGHADNHFDARGTGPVRFQQSALLPDVET